MRSVPRAAIKTTTLRKAKPGTSEFAFLNSCAQWHPPASTVVWMAASGSRLVVLHDLIYALVWMAIASEFLRRSHLGRQ